MEIYSPPSTNTLLVLYKDLFAFQCSYMHNQSIWICIVIMALIKALDGIYLQAICKVNELGTS